MVLTENMQFKLRDYIDDKQKLINTTLQKILFDFTLEGRLADAMSYAVIANGKRLRPILCIATGEAIGSYQHQDQR